MSSNVNLFTSPKKRQTPNIVVARIDTAKNTKPEVGGASAVAKTVTMLTKAGSTTKATGTTSEATTSSARLNSPINSFLSD